MNKELMIQQGYVPKICTLPEPFAGMLIWSEINQGRDVCEGCNADRNICKGRPKNMNKDKPAWLDRVKATHAFHVNKLRQDENHTIAQTAKLLKRAIGPVCEDLKVARWLKSHSSQLEEFEHFKEAIEWIRVRKHKLMLEELD